MNCGCFGIIAGVALIIGGGQGVWTGLKNRTPTEIAITDLQGEDPKASWLRVTGGELDMTNATWLSAFGVGAANEIYVPVVAPGTDSTTEPIHLILMTRDKELVRFINDSQELGEKSEEEAIDFLEKNFELIRPARTVEGLAQFGIESDRDIDKVRDLYDNLSKNGIILEDGGKPEIGLSIVLLIAGVGILGFFGFSMVSSGDLAEADGEITGVPPQ